MNVDGELLRRHAARPDELIVEDGCFTNWIGLRTEAELFDNKASELRNQVFPELPLHDDGVYAGYFEYASWLTAIEAGSDRSQFSAVELGAGWGPWISGIGVVCKRAGFRHVDLVGVEADQGRCEAMRRHLKRNGLLDDPAVTCRTIHAAAWKENTTLSFPVIPVQDHGGAISLESSGADYRGRVPSYVSVEAQDLATICNGLEVVDFMHWDVQGAELEIARGNLDFLNRKVRFLFIGTHSRPIEGALMELFFAQQWDLLHDRPCAFVYDRSKPTLEGMGTSDGDLFVRNPRLG